MAAAAQAQLAVSVSAVSDYRYRGASIGSDQPAATLNLAYDARASGGVDPYVGDSLTVGPLPDAGLQVFNQSAYAGLAGPLREGLSWDIGVDHTVLAKDVGGLSHGYSPEVYAGVRSAFLSTYVRYSPHYFRDGLGVLYWEVEASAMMTARWRAFAQAGALTPVTSPDPYYPRREQYDGRVGVDTLFRGVILGLAWTFQRPGYGDYGPSITRPDAVVVTATCVF